MSRARLLPLSLILSLSACVPELPEDKSPAEGAASGDCTDRADNDEDGLFDCDDEGCAASPDCTAAPAAPEGLAVAIDPTTPMDADDLRCAVTTEAVDPNGDAVSYAFAWSVDGADAGLSTDVVGNALTVPGQTWTCTVTPSDGTLTGTPGSASVSIQRENAAPSAPGVAITPAEPTDDDALTCAVVTESVDPDGDTVTYAWAWTVDGVDAGVTVASVDAARTSAGETWTCSVTASDGSAVSGAGSASVRVSACTSFSYLTFDGVDDHVSLPSMPSLGAGFTYEAWLRGAPATADEALMSTECGSVYRTSYGVWVDVFPACTGTSQRYTTDPEGYHLEISDWPESWFHLGVVASSAYVDVYLDGNHVAGGPLAFDNGVGGRNANTMFVRMDVGHSGEDMYAYARADVAGIRVSEGATISGPFVPEFPFVRGDATRILYAIDEGSGERLRDATGGGRDASIVGATWHEDCR